MVDPMNGYVAGAAPTDLSAVFAKVEALRTQYAKRDQFVQQVRAVRQGDFDQIAPGIFPEEWPRPVCANVVDSMARDFAAKLAPLPSFNCSGSSSLTDTAKRFADKRSKIANNYVTRSRLHAQMFDVGDGYNAYGLAAWSVEPDFDGNFPRIRQEDGAVLYPVWNRSMETIACAKIYYQYTTALEADYPKIAQLRKQYPSATAQGDRVKVVKYCDTKQCVVYCPDLGNYVLEQYANPIGKCLFVCVPRPNGLGTYGAVLRGQYDDLIWPQIARNEFQILALEAADKAVRAPIIVPPDVTDIAFGPDAVLPTNNPQGVQRLKVDVPPASFQAMEWLRQDMELGGMSPASRTGNVQANVITGRGIEALQDGYSAQLAQAQEMIRFGLEQVIMLCFQMDEKLWPDLQKEIRGQDGGVPYSVKYTPSKDIAGDHTIDIQYGFLAGMDANRALIFILQAYGAGLISGDYAMRQLPANFNVSEEAKKIELEKMRHALLDALAATGQALPQMIAQGQDPSKVVAAMAAVTDGIKKGNAIEDIISQVFAPPPPPAAAPGAGAPGDLAAALGAPGSDAAAQGAQGFQGNGMPQGVHPGLATEGANGRPDLMMLLSGITQRNQPNLQANVSRMMPTATQ